MASAEPHASEPIVPASAPPERAAIDAALDTWIARPSAQAHATLVTCVREAVATARGAAAPSDPEADPLAQLLQSWGDGARPARSVRRLRTLVESPHPARQRLGRLLLALVDTPDLASPPLPHVERVTEAEARAWLQLLELGAPDSDGVIAFIGTCFDTRPRSLWKPAARALGRLATWSERARAWLAPLEAIARAGADVAARARNEAERRLLRARATHLRRHFAYMRCVRLAAGDPDAPPLPDHFDALLIEHLGAAARSHVEPADASIVLDGLSLLVGAPGDLGAAARGLVLEALADPRLRYERQTCDVLRSLHDTVEDLAGHEAGDAHAGFCRQVRHWLSAPALIERDAGVHRVDAAQALLETAWWMQLRSDEEALERLAAADPRYREAIRIVTRGVEPGDDERLVRHLALLLDPLRRATTFLEPRHVATVEVLALLGDEDLGECDWPAFLARAGAPDPHARPGRVADAGWMDACLRLFFAGQVPAGLLRDVPLDSNDLRRITHALQLRNLPVHVRSLVEGSPDTDITHHAGLEFGTPGLQVDALIRQLAVETDRALARIPLQPRARTDADDTSGTREEQLRLLWSVLEDDPSQTFFEQLHDCLRGSDTPLHRLVRALQNLDWERDRRNEERWAAQGPGRAEPVAPRRADLDAFQRELERVRNEMRAYLDGTPTATRRASSPPPRGPLRLFEAFLDAGSQLLTTWTNAAEATGGWPTTPPPALLAAMAAEATPCDTSTETHARAVVGVFGAYVDALGTWHAWVEPSSGATGPGPDDASWRFHARMRACRDALAAWCDAALRLPSAARGAHRGWLLGLCLRLEHVPQRALLELASLCDRLALTAEELLAVEHQIPWPSRETTCWLAFRIAAEARLLKGALAAQRDERTTLEARVDRDMALGDTTDLLLALRLPRDDQPPLFRHAPDPVAHLDDDRITEIFWHLTHRARFREADELRKLVRDRLQLPSRLHHLRTLLAACAAGPLLILDIGEEWNALLGHPDHALGASYWGLVTGCFALVLVVLYIDIPQHQRADGRGPGFRYRLERIAATFRLLRPALLMSLASSVVVLLTLTGSPIRVADDGRDIPFGPQLLLWTALSMVLGILLGVVLQGRSLTRQRRIGEA